MTTHQSPTLAPATGVTALVDTNYQTEQVSDYEAAYWGPNYERLQQVCMSRGGGGGVGLGGWMVAGQHERVNDSSREAVNLQRSACTAAGCVGR